MKAIVGALIGFAAGGAIGYFVGSKLTEKKCREACEQEIESVKEAFSKDHKITVEDIRSEAEEKSRVAAEKAKNKPDILKYQNVLKREGYRDAFNELRTSTKGDDKEFPYVITPEEYGELPDYEKSSLIYYEEDGVIATESDEVVDTPDDIIGLDSLKHFGEYTSDCIYVRNDKLKCDYEVLRDPGSFEDMMRNKPYAHEDDDE